MKKIIVGIAMAAMSLFMGCDQIKSIVNNVDAETYAQMAGKAVATIVTSTNKWITAESKAAFAETLSEVIAKMPKDIAMTNLQAFVEKTVDAKLATTVKDATKLQAYSTAFKAAFNVVEVALTTVEKKYAEDFSNADKAYSLVMAFLNAVNDTFTAKLAAAPETDEYKKVYEDILKAVQLPATK